MLSRWEREHGVDFDELDLTWLDCVFGLLMFVHVSFHFCCIFIRQLLAQCFGYQIAPKIASRSCNSNGNGVYSSLVGFDPQADWGPEQREGNPAWWVLQALWVAQGSNRSRGTGTVLQWLDTWGTQRWVLCQGLCTGWGRILQSAISRRPRQASFWSISPTNIVGKALWRLWNSTRMATSSINSDQKPWKLFKGACTIDCRVWIFDALWAGL